MPVRMVGRKTGSEENETLQEKYMKAVSQFLTSNRAKCAISR